MKSGEGYKTRQRDLIFEFFVANKEKHVTADEVLEHLKGQGNSVGKSTVYRYLDRLVNEGKVRKYYIEEGMGACYQYVGDKEECNNHFHLKCIRCGRLIHIKCDYLSEVDEHISKHHDFKVDNTKTVLYGICNRCS